MQFFAHVIQGSGRGKGMGTPTLNVDLGDVPSDLEEGIYACKVMVDDGIWNGAMHYGPRPVHKDTKSCEVHILDEELLEAPESIDVEVVGYLRPVLDFASEEALIAQIADDIEKARGMLSAYDSSSEEAHS